MNAKHRFSILGTVTAMSLAVHSDAQPPAGRMGGDAALDALVCHFEKRFGPGR